MFRILIVIIVSFSSVVGYLIIFHRWMGLNDDWAGYISLPLAWVVTPIILLTLWKEKPDPYVIPIDPKDPIIIEQISRSQSEINRFLVALNEDKMEAYIKFSFTFGEEVEHVWGLAHKLKDGKIITSLESDPIGEIPKEAYERIHVALEEVEDWMLVDGEGTTHGGYSNLALAKIYTREYGKLPKQYTSNLKRFADFSWPENT